MVDRIICGVWAVASAITVALSKTRRLRGKPPQESRWVVGEGERIGWAVFTPTRSWATRFHVWAILSDDDDLWVFDPNSDQWGLSRLPTITPDTLPTLLRRLDAQYVIEVRGETPQSAFVATPVSCVTLVKSALGITAPSAHTPEQLLEHLWRSRCGREDQESS